METVSNQGHEMARELDSTTADDAPAVAKLAVDQMIKAYPAKARTVNDVRGAHLGAVGHRQARGEGCAAEPSTF